MQKHPLLEQQPTSGANTAVPSTLGNNNGFGNVNNNNSNLSSIPSLLLMNNLNNGNRLLNNPSTNFSSSSFLNNSLSNNNTSNLLQQQLIDHHNQQIQQYLPNNNLKPNLLKTEFPINDFSTPMEHQLNTLNNVINNNNSNVNNLSSNNPFSLYNNPIISNNNNNLVNQLFPVNNNNNNNNNLLNSNNNGLINNANINNNSNILNNPNLLLNNNNPIVNNNNTTINNNGNTNNGMTTSQSNTSLSSLQTQQQANSTNNTAVNNMKKPRKVAKLACVSCRKAHACCEDKRPCSRCLVHGLECVDQVGKKRGRKKKSDKDENEEGNTEVNNNGANSSNSNNNNSAVDAQANSVNGSNNNASVKKRKRRSSKKNQEENSKQENTSSQEINNNNSVVINNNNNNNGMQLLSNNNNDASSLLATELTTPGANNIISRLMYNQSNNAIQNFPLFVNQPPEIQQLTQVLLRTPVDTFYLHCNNLNAAYNENQNNYLFGTPIQIPASSLNNNASCSSNAPNQQILNNQQMISGLSPNILNNLSFNNSLNLQHAFSPNSPLHDLIKDDEFLRFSPQSPLFESLIELDDEPLGIVNNTSSSSSGTSSSNEQQVYLPVTPNQQQQTNIEQQQIPALTPTTINTEENNNNDLIGLELLKDEGDFERLKKMSNEDLIKSLQIGDEIKQMIEASINQLKSFDSDNNLREKTYIEYLTQNFPISLLLKHKLSETAKRLEKREEEYDKREFESLEEEIRVLREENKKLKEENIRKSNESAMLSAINENLRNRFTEIISKEKEGKTTSNVNASNSSNQSNNSYPTTPTYIPSSLDSSSARSTEAKSLENSYQELCMLMENKDEMDSSSFGIMIMFPGGRLVSLNKTFLVKLGYEPGDLYDKLERWEDVVHPSSYPHVVAHVSRILKLPPAPRKSFKCKVKLRRKDGSILGAELYLCIVGGKLSYIPVFAIGYFLFEEIGKTIQQ